MTFHSPRLLGGTLILACLSQLVVGGVISRASAAIPDSRQVAAAATGDPYRSGVSYLRAGKYKQAEAQFRLAISRHERPAEAYNGLANAAISLHDYPTAYHAFKQAATLSPREPLLQYRTAYAALYAAYYHEAVHYASTYIKMRPKDWQGYHLRFLAYGNLLKPKPQVTDATAVVQLRPNDAAAWNDLGIALTNVKQFKGALTAEAHAIKLQPANGNFYMNRGITENANKQFGPALRDFKTARSLTRDPSLRKQLDAAIQYLQKRVHQ